MPNNRGARSRPRNADAVTRRPLLPAPYDLWWTLEGTVQLSTACNRWAGWFVSPDLKQCAVIADGTRGPLFPYNPNKGGLSPNNLKKRIDTAGQPHEAPPTPFEQKEQLQELTFMFGALNGEEPDDVMDPEAHSQQIVRSADGTRIAYAGRVDAKHEIFVVDGKPIRVRGSVAEFGFSPDSARWFATFYTTEPGEESAEGDGAGGEDADEGEEHVYLIVDGIQEGEFHVTGLEFSPDSASWAAIGWRKESANRSGLLISLNGIEHCFDGRIVHWHARSGTRLQDHLGSSAKYLQWLPGSQIVVLPVEEETDGEEDERKGTGKMHLHFCRLDGEFRSVECGALVALEVDSAGTVVVLHADATEIEGCYRNLSELRIDPEVLFS